MNYKHFTILERENILKFIAQDLSKAEIARRLKRHRSNIGREIKRNLIDREYSLFKAERAYKKRKQKCGCKNSVLLIDIQKKLEEGWTPEQISERAKLDKLYSVSFKTIYRGIRAGFFQEETIKLLPRKGKVRKNGVKEKRGRIPDKKMIEERPQGANDRSEIGYYEGDAIVGKDHKEVIMTYVCRKTRLIIAELMPDRKAKTFTSENGKEFSKFKELEDELGIKTYFANPYHSWERGTNENTNGLLRRFFPKGIEFLKLTKEEIIIAVQKINNRPRKCLNWKTPQEEFWEAKCCV